MGNIFLKGNKIHHCWETGRVRALTLGFLLGLDRDSSLLIPAPRQHWQLWEEFPGCGSSPPQERAGLDTLITLPSPCPTPAPVFMLERVRTCSPKVWVPWAFEPSLSGVCSVGINEVQHLPCLCGACCSFRAGNFGHPRMAWGSTVGIQ